VGLRKVSATFTIKPGVAVHDGPSWLQYVTVGEPASASRGAPRRRRRYLRALLPYLLVRPTLSHYLMLTNHRWHVGRRPNGRKET